MKNRLKLAAFVVGAFLVTAGAIWLSTNGKAAWAQEVMYRGSGDPNDSASAIVTRIHGDTETFRVEPMMNFCCKCAGWKDPNGGEMPLGAGDPNTYPCRSYYSVDTAGLTRTCFFGAEVTTAADDPGDPNSNQPVVQFWAEASSDHSHWYRISPLAAPDDPNLRTCTGPITPLDPNDGDWTWWPDPNRLWPVSPCQRIYVSDGTLPRYLRILYQTDINQPGYLTDPNDPNSEVVYHTAATLAGRILFSCSK